MQAAHEMTYRPRRSQQSQRPQEVYFKTNTDRPVTGDTRPTTGDSREDYYYDRSLYGEKEEAALPDVPEDRAVGTGYYYTRRPVRY
jgi:hypothetical protein